MVLVRAKKKRTKKNTPAIRRAPAAAASVTKAEVTALGKAIRSLGGALGGAAGGMLGQPLAGGVLGHSLAGALSRWMGTGDYTVGTNSVVQRSLKAAASIPSMHSDAQSIVVRHKEYLGEIRSAQVFTVQQSFPLNPGLSTTFPWMSGIASKFQEYKLRGLVFHYVPTSGAAVSSTNAALGSVMLQTSYRSTDALPLSKVEMLNEYCSNEVVPSETMAHPVECDPRENPFNVQYVRSGPVPAADTQLMYDLGVTHVAVSGCQTSGNVLGDLWVTYDIELKKPVVLSDAVSSTFSGSRFLFTGSYTTTSIFGASQTTLVGTLAATTLGQVLTFPKGVTGSFLVVVRVVGSSLTMNSSTFPVTNCTLTAPFSGSATTGYSDVTSSQAVVFTTAVVITDPAVNATVSINTGGTGTITGTYVVVAELA